ncbi:monoamine oxidase n [Ilyonectria robusta]
MTLPTSSEGFIWNIKTGELVSGLQTPSKKEDSTTSYPTKYNVIVIGAGFAGAVAARDLYQAGKSVLVLEARDRIGGRTWSAKGLNNDYEMGGGWIHWLQPNIFAEVSRYDLSPLPASTGFDAGVPTTSVRDGREFLKPTKVTLQDADARTLPLMAKFYDIDGYGGRTVFPQPNKPLLNPEGVKKWDISIQERIDQLDISEDDKVHLAMWLNMQGLARPEKTGFLNVLRLYALSSYDYNAFVEMNSRYKAPGGTTALISHMWNEYKGVSLFNRPVTSVVTKYNEAEVTTENGEIFTADQVIVTIPLNVYADVKFTPPLPAAFTTTKHVNLGGKIHLHTEKIAPGWFGCSTTDRSALFGFTESPSQGGGTNMVLFLSDENVVKDTGLEVHVREVAKNVQGDLIPEDMGLTFTDISWHDWTKDKWSKGTWATYGPRTLSEGLGEIMKNRKVTDRVRFANSDIADGWVGYMDGAIEQGRRAAYEILQGK